MPPAELKYIAKNKEMHAFIRIENMLFYVTTNCRSCIYVGSRMLSS